MATRNTQRTASAPKSGQPPRRLRYYLVQFSYTSEAWADLLRDDTKRDRIAAVKPIVEGLGGCFPEIVFPCEYPPVVQEGKWASFGDHDVVALIAFPSDRAAAAFAMTISQGHGVKSFKTTPLLSWDEARAAMGDAAGQIATYRPPGGRVSRR
jgi:uncharacterized protein with GYD domain